MTATSRSASVAVAKTNQSGGGLSWSVLIFLGPAALFLLVFLVYPMIYTLFLSFNRGRGGEFTNWVGLDNWIRLFTNDPNFLRLGIPPSGALWNNVLWILFYVSLTVLLGLIIAVGIWGSVGFATVILSAAIKGISSEVLEAARVDGATETQIFWRVIVPMVSLPISVVAVTLVVNVIKLFDLIYVMTAGGPGAASRVIAFSMYQEAFPQGQFGYGATIAVVMVLLLIPVMIFNIRRFRAEAVQS